MFFLKSSTFSQKLSTTLVFLIQKHNTMITKNIVLRLYNCNTLAEYE